MGDSGGGGGGRREFGGPYFYNKIADVEPLPEDGRFCQEARKKGFWEGC